MMNAWMSFRLELTAYRDEAEGSTTSGDLGLGAALAKSMTMEGGPRPGRDVFGN